MDKKKLSGLAALTLAFHRGDADTVREHRGDRHHDDHR